MSDRILDTEARRPRDEVNGTASPPVPQSNGKSEEQATKINGDAAGKSDGSSEAETPCAVTIEAGGDDGGAGSTDPGTDERRRPSPLRPTGFARRSAKQLA
jgi:hypothetical protein